MHIKILGCGGSSGVPEIGCNCFVCKSRNTKNIRTRSSILLQAANKNIIVDTSPDMRQQLLRESISNIDAVLYTHSHADHVNGIDDIKQLARNGPVQAYMDEATFNSINTRFDYIFKAPTNSVYPAVMLPHVITSYECFDIGGVKVQAYEQMHRNMLTLGFRFGNIAYSTDFSYLPEQSIDTLSGIHTWIISCLSYGAAPTHCCWEDTMRYIRIVNPELAVLTHMNHSIDYDQVLGLAPNGVIPAYDDMKVI